MGLAYGLFALLGLLVAGIGFNVGHDALHGAYSSRSWVNELMGHSFTIMGANPYVWKSTHNVVHHSFTNIVEADGDLHPVKWLRFTKGLPQHPYHRFQHLYAPVLYCMTALVWVFRKDFDYIKRRRHLLYEKPPVPRKVYRELIVGKALYYLAFIGLPLLLMPMTCWQVLLGFCLMQAVAGFTLAVVFQLGHLVEGTEFHQLNSLSSGASSQLESWSVHQLKSSAIFAMRHRWNEWIYGGLNYQIEHHLFPRICHVHYRHLAPIVQKTAAEFHLPYVAYSSFGSAFASHLRYLKATGRSDDRQGVAEAA